MGVVQRQGFKSTIPNLMGIGVGAMGIVWVYPQALAEYGLITFLTDAGSFFAAAASFGIQVTMLRFFPKFNNEEQGHYGVLTWSILVQTVGVLLFALFFWLGQDSIQAFYADKPDLERDYINYLPLFALLIGCMSVLNQYCAIFKRVAVGFMVDFVMKLVRPFLVILYIGQWISVQSLVWGLLLGYLGAVCLFLLYIQRMGQLYLRPKITLFTKSFLKEIAAYKLYYVMGWLMIFVGTQLDKLTVAAFIGMEDNGVYAIALFLTMIIITPFIMISTIAAPLVSEHFAKQELDKIHDLYQKSAINSLLIGGFILLGIVVCVDDLFRLTHNYTALQAGIGVVWLLAITRVIDTAASLSREILSLSPHYRVTLWLSFATVVTNIGLTYWLIADYKLIGIAVANLVSMCIYAGGRVVIVYYFYKMHPFSFQILWLTLFGIVAYLPTMLIPSELHPFLGILIKGSIATLVYVPLVLYFKLAPDFNDLIFKILNRILAVVKRKNV